MTAIDQNHQAKTISRPMTKYQTGVTMKKLAAPPMPRRSRREKREDRLGKHYLNAVKSPGCETCARFQTDENRNGHCRSFQVDEWVDIFEDKSVEE
ncbi:MAG: hypothetical protein QW828_04980 [Candidatus Bathyarchaeia archaeon]